MRKTSFLREQLGEELYDKLTSYVMPWIPLYTVVWIILFVLSKFCYWKIFSGAFSLLSGFSLLSLAYLAMLVVALDIQVYVDDEIELCKNRKYKLTKYFAIFLIICAIFSAFWSNSYGNNYSFKCSTVYVDGGEYHVYDDCEYIDGVPVEKKGYEAEEEGYESCNACEEWLEDMQSEHSDMVHTHP